MRRRPARLATTRPASQRRITGLGSRPAVHGASHQGPAQSARHSERIPLICAALQPIRLRSEQCRHYVKSALHEQVAEIRPQLAKAREIAEKAEAEHREMTAEEQKTFDEIMAKGRQVSDAVKAHRHDQEVLAFAKELSDEVIGPA